MPVLPMHKKKRIEILMSATKGYQDNLELGITLSCSLSQFSHICCVIIDTFLTITCQQLINMTISKKTESKGLQLLVISRPHEVSKH